MTQQTRTPDHVSLARLGASVRLGALERERSEILKTYPRLKPYKDVDLRPRRKVSAAARAAMSEGMRKFWARRKAAKKS